MNEIVTNYQNLAFMLKIGLYVIGILMTVIGAMIGMYLSSQLRTLKRLEDIDIELTATLNIAKDRLNEHIGDSSYRFEVLQDRLAKLEKTDGDHDDKGALYLRRRYDSPKLLSKPPRKPKPP